MILPICYIVLLIILGILMGRSKWFDIFMNDLLNIKRKI